MSTQSYDAVATGLSRIAGQAVGKQKFSSFLQVLLQGVADDVALAAQLYDCIDVDLSSGAQLDVLGRIVGQSRTILHAVTLPFFGFASENGSDYQAAVGYGDNAYPTQGAALFDNQQSLVASSQADDSLFRRMIAIRILRNNVRLDAALEVGPILPAGEASLGEFWPSGALAPLFVWGGPKPWIEVLNAILLYIFPTASAHAYPLGIDDQGGMHLEIFIGTKPSAVQTALLLYAGLLPVPQGVGFSATWWNGDVFGFDGYAGALGYGDNVHPSQGGSFAERLG